MTLDTAKNAPPPHEIQQLESDETAAGPAVEATAVATTDTTSGAMMIARGVPTEAEFAPSSISFSIFFLFTGLSPTARLQRRKEEEILVPSRW